MFEINTFLKEHSPLFTVCNLFIVISLYLTNYLHNIEKDLPTTDITTTTTNTLLIGWCLVFFSSLFVYLIFINIIDSCLNSRDQELIIYKKLKIRDDDPERIMVIGLIFIITILFYFFILSQANNPIFSIIAVIILISPFLFKLFILLKKNKHSLEFRKFRVELTQILQLIEDLDGDNKLIKTSNDFPIEKIRVLTTKIFNFQDKIQEFSTNLNNNLFYQSGNSSEDEDPLRMMQTESNILFLKIFGNILIKFVKNLENMLRDFEENLNKISNSQELNDYLLVFEKKTTMINTILQGVKISIEKIIIQSNEEREMAKEILDMCNESIILSQKLSFIGSKENLKKYLEENFIMAS